MVILNTNSWISEVDADTYFTDRLGASTFWISGADKVPALITAFKQINSMNYSFPSTATQMMKDAQCEQALFLLMDTAIDKRLSIQAQGVKTAGIVKESYQDRKEINQPALSPMAKALLIDYISIKTNVIGTLITEIQRDEKEGDTFIYA